MWACPCCDGYGNIVLIGCVGVPAPRQKGIQGQLYCPQCNGSGQIDSRQMEAIEFGEKVQNYRLTVLRTTLRETTKQIGVKPSEQSCLEMGRTQPPDITYESLKRLREYWEQKIGEGHAAHSI